jgi:aminoglycoside/choline kinase family phosphotransferase
LSRSNPLPAAPEIAAWLAARGWGEARIEPLAGDVGHRRYQRASLGDGSSVVVVVHPAQLREACRRFVATSRLLDACGVRVPQVLAADCEAGLMLVEDLGAATLEEWSAGRGWDEVAPRFRRALQSARRVAGLDPRQVAPLSPPLDAALLSRELRLAQEHFLQPHGLAEGVSARRLEAALAALAEAVARVLPVPCHRDFMVRNLMPWDGGVAVLDHQDLRLGPPLYDLASLLNDSLFPPAELEAELVAEWCGGEDRWTEYHRVAAQRTLKACGSYAMAAAAGKEFHLKRMAPTFARALGHLARVPETEDVAGELAAAWEAGKGAMMAP